MNHKAQVLKIFYCLDFGDCRYRGYNEAQGHVKSVAKNFKDNNSAATTVHCLAYYINICLQEVTRSPLSYIQIKLQ